MEKFPVISLFNRELFQKRFVRSRLRHPPISLRRCGFSAATSQIVFPPDLSLQLAACSRIGNRVGLTRLAATLARLFHPIIGHDPRAWCEPGHVAPSRDARAFGTNRYRAPPDCDQPLQGALTLEVNRGCGHVLT